MKTAPVPYALVYRVDASNRITWVNAAWSEFARNNQGETVMPARILGRDLLGLVMDETVAQLYAAMLKRVRSGTAVKFTYRCDAPDKRRMFAMDIGLLASGEVEFVSTLTHEEGRPPVALLAAGGTRSSELLRVCSWCQKVATPAGHWLPVEEAVATLRLMETEQLPAITHGMCGPCLVAARATLGLA